MDSILATATPRPRRSTRSALAEWRVRTSLAAVVMIVFASLSIGVAGFVLSSSSPAHALATYGPITSITLSNSTISESGVAYQLTANQVPNASSSTTLTATFDGGTAAWANGLSTGGLATATPATVPLDVGWNTITVTHTGADTTTITTYAIRIFRGGEFTNLTFTTPGLSLTPAWSKDTYAYTLPDVPYETQSITFTVQTTRDEAGTLECNHCDWWLYHSRGTMTATLTPGQNVLNYTFYQGSDYYQDPIHYLITINRALPFGPDRLTDLTIAGSTITPASEMYHFSAEQVSNATASVPLTATFDTGTVAWDAGASSGALTSGVPTTVPLGLGWNTVTVAHTNPDTSVVTTYAIRMFRGGEFTDLTFTTPGMTLSPAWDKGVHAYTLPDVPYETQTLSFTVVTTRNEAGTLECNQCDWWLYHDRGTMAVTLHPGENVINFSFYQGADYYQDPIHYTVTITRGSPFSADRLTDLTVPGSSLTTASALYSWNAAQVSNTTASTPLSATFDTGTAVWANGSSTGSLLSATPATVPLTVGWNTITVTHTSTDESTVTSYTIRIFRGGEFTNLTFTTPGLTLTPEWSKDTHVYALPDVAYETQTITFTVETTRDEAGTLECDHCDWWLFHDRGPMTATLTPGANCLNFKFYAGADYYQARVDYWVSINRGPVSDAPACPAVVPTTEPATTEPATTEPATTEPATTEPATTEPPTSTTVLPTVPPSDGSTTSSTPVTSTTSAPATTSGPAEVSSSTTSATSTSAAGSTSTSETPSSPTFPAHPVEASDTTLPPPPLNVVESLPVQVLATQEVYLQGQFITVSADGFVPGEYVQLILASTPQVIAAGYADASGSITLTGGVPSDLATGHHTVAVFAPGSNQGAQQAIVVGAGAGELPSTGTNLTPLLELAFAVLAAGAVIVLVRRRPRVA